MNNIGKSLDLPQTLSRSVEDASKDRVKITKQWFRSNGLQQPAEEEGKKADKFESRIQTGNKGKLNLTPPKKPMATPMSQKSKDEKSKM